MLKTKYYYAEVFYKNGKKPDRWRFDSKRKRSSALRTFRRDSNVLDIIETEKLEDQ